MPGAPPWPSVRAHSNCHRLPVVITLTACAHAVDERQVFVPATCLVPQWQQPVSVMAPMTRADDDDELTSFFAPPLPSESRFLGRFEISAPPTMLNA